MRRDLKITKSITDRQDASLGLYFKDVSRLPLLSAEEEIIVGNKAREGDQKSIDRLVTSNLRFVISIAKQYQGKGLPLVDLIQAGNQGLIESTRKFNPDKGYRFISFAVWWIRQAILKSLSDQCRTIRVPINQILNINKINSASRKFEQENGRKPTTLELEKETNLSVEKIDHSLKAVRRSTSLDAPFKDEDVGSLLDVIPNKNSNPSDLELDKEDTTKEVLRILNKLSYRDGDIMKMSFGIGMTSLPNSEIAKRFGIGAERVRQIQKDSIQFLKDNYINEFKGIL